MTPLRKPGVPSRKELYEILKKRSITLMNNINIYCDWCGFVWCWNFKDKVWEIDVLKSGGTPQNQPYTDPPYTIIKND